MSEHTKEQRDQRAVATPWSRGPYGGIYGADETKIVQSRNLDHPVNMEVEYRVVECVNALAGLNPEVLPELMLRIDDAVRFLSCACRDTDGYVCLKHKMHDILERLKK